MRFKNKSVLITGAARGIGLAYAEAFATHGARVCIADINFEAACLAADQIGQDCFAVHMDVSDLNSLGHGVHACIEEAGQIDVLINSAAVFTAAPIVEIEPNDFQRTFDINVKGPVFLTKTVAKHMIDRGKGGKIINMASQAGRRGEALVAVYCATKAAIISFTQSAGLNLIKHGINVNAIAPGVVDGDHWDCVDAYFAKYEGKPAGQKKIEVGESVPFGRMGTAQDLVGMALFLAGPESDYVVAQTFGVDGGNWMA